MAKAKRIVDPKTNERLFAASGPAGSSRPAGKPSDAGKSRAIAARHDAMDVVLAVYVCL